MTANWRPRFTGAVAAACAAALITGCGGHGDNPAGAAPSASAATSASAEGGVVPVYHYGIDDHAVGPAPAVPGAASGGTVRVYDVADYYHLDPARIYASTEGRLSFLLTRGLTGYRQKGTDVTLVGDLATDTGRTKDGGKTWTFTLRDGITWEDGSTITSQEVKYGLERTFVPDFSEGPTYLQTWLAGTSDYHKVYKGPYVGGKELDTIGAPDDKTLTLTFKKPQPDLPFALALPFSAPVKKSKDTRTKYDQHPFSSGPYKIADRKIDKSLTLVRNTAWKPESDPLRTQYPDRFEFTFGELPLATNQRLIAAVGGDAAAMTVIDAVSPEVLPKVLADPALKARTVSGITPGVGYVAINTRRITDLKVRKALMYAYPREQIRQLLGGPDNGDFASTLSSPTLIGHEQYDLFQVPPKGDPEKAKALLAEAGKSGQKIVLVYGNVPRGEQVAVIEAQGLEKAGFTVVKKPLNIKTAQDDISRPDNQFDLYGAGWQADWPSGATVFPPLFDGRQIRPGGYNTSFFNDPAINKEMDEISAIADPVEAGHRWSRLEQKIMAQVPMFPNLYSRIRQLHGPKIGGLALDNVQGGVSLNGVYVIP
jgi:peptide/nickel transport system substrate-binding protein